VSGDRSELLAKIFDEDEIARLGEIVKVMPLLGRITFTDAVYAL